MHNQHHLGHFLVYIRDNLVDQGTHESFLQTQVCRRVMPDSFQVLCQVTQLGARRWRRGRHSPAGLVDPLLERLDAFERRVPTTLEFIRHQAIRGISVLILLAGAFGCVPRRLKFPFQRHHDIVLSPKLFGFGTQRSFQRRRLQHPQ